MFPQNGVPIDELKNFIGSAYKTLENEIADWVEAGAEVKYSVRLDDFDAKGRPSVVDVVFEALHPDTGATVRRVTKDFDNEAGQTLDRMSRGDIRELMGTD